MRKKDAAAQEDQIAHEVQINFLSAFSRENRVRYSHCFIDASLFKLQRSGMTLLPAVEASAGEPRDTRHGPCSLLVEQIQMNPETADMGPSPYCFQIHEAPHAHIELPVS